MPDESNDVNRQLMLDGNAVAGMLQEIFGLDMTTNPAECANCGQVTEMGGLLAFTQAPGMILRCPSCEEVMLRVVETPNGIFIDARGAGYVRLVRSSSR